MSKKNLLNDERSKAKMKPRAISNVQSACTVGWYFMFRVSGELLGVPRLDPKEVTLSYTPGTQMGPLF